MDLFCVDTVSTADRHVAAVLPLQARIPHSDGAGALPQQAVA